MSKKEMFFKLCDIMADMEDAINVFESIGAIMEPDKGMGWDLYNAASVAYDLASSLLEFPDVGKENEVFDALMRANKDNVSEIAKEVWNEYGIK